MVIHARNYWQEDAICFLSLWKVEWITENQSRKYYSRNTPYIKRALCPAFGTLQPACKRKSPVSRQETSEETASKVLCPAFGTLQPACKRKSPVLTELLPYQGTNGLDGLPPRQKGNKKEDIPVLTGISSLTWKKGGYLLSRFAGSTIGVSGLNFSVRNGKRWDTAAIATIISDSGIHAAQHYIGKRRIIPLTSNQQNIKKQTGMYMKKHPCEKKYRVPDKSFRAISSARLWRRRLYTCILSTL